MIKYKIPRILKYISTFCQLDELDHTKNMFEK